LVRCGLLVALALACPQVQGLRISSTRDGTVDPSEPPGDALETAVEDDSIQANSIFAAEEAGAEADSERDEGAISVEGMEHFKALPNLSLFYDQWKNFTAHGLGGHVWSHPHTTPTMIIGIFSSLDSQDWEYRQVIRETWMKESSICTLADYPAKTSVCRFFVTFVVASDAARMHRERNGTEAGVHPNDTDITALSVPENMNCGKTLAWFELAAAKFPKATHIAKMDMDAFVDVRRLLMVMRRFSPQCPHHYGGRPWQCPQPGYCPPASCGHPLGTDFFEYKSQDKKCWTYMQGGFYFMSTPLATRLTEIGGWWDQQSSKCLPEDAILGKAVNLFGRANYECVGVLSLLSKEVIWHPDWTGYWEPPFYDPE